MAMADNDHGKGRIDELTLEEKNRILEEDVKTLTLKLGNSEGQNEILRCKVRELEEEVRALKLGNTGTVHADVSDFFKTRDLLEEENRSLRLEHLELTVKHQMQIMWRIIHQKLENTEGLVDGLQSKVYILENAIKILKSGMSCEQNDVSDLSNTRVPLEEENKLLRLELLELTVKYQMRKIWKMINLEMKGNSLPSKQGEQRAIESDADMREREEKIISTVIQHHEIPTETNPFENERIVSHIMGYVNPEDLLRCRQVCKLWRNAAQKDFEGKITFSVRNTMHDLFRIPLFMEDADKSFPTFRNLKLDLDCNFWADEKKFVSALFLKHGKQLHKLELDFGGNGFSGGSWSLDDFRDIFLNSLKEIREFHISIPCQLIHRERIFLSYQSRNVLRNLTTLNIGLKCLDCQSIRHKTTRVFLELLQLIPNLRVLSWKSCGSKGIQATPKFIESLVRINPFKLEKLFILSDTQDFVLDLIASSQLNLNQLNLHNFQSFQLQLVSSACGRMSKIVPRNKYYLTGNMKPVLEALQKAVVQCGNVSCTELLHVFMTTLAAFPNTRPRRPRGSVRKK